MAQLSKTLPNTPSPRQIARFLTVGVLGTGIDLALFAVLYAWFGFPVISANVIAYSFGILHNYFLHRYWTYGHAAHKPVPKQAAQFVAVSLCAMVMNTALVVLLGPPLNTLLAGFGNGDLLAKLCATSIGVGVNFLANHFWTFRATREGDER